MVFYSERIRYSEFSVSETYQKLVQITKFKPMEVLARWTCDSLYPKRGTIPSLAVLQGGVFHHFELLMQIAELCR